MGDKKKFYPFVSLAFAVLFASTLLSLLYTQTILFFRTFLLALFFVMRRLVRQWRQAEQCLGENPDDVPQSGDPVKPGVVKKIVFVAGVTLGSVAVSFFILVLFVATAIVPSEGYRERSYLSLLKSDLNNAHLSAQAYLADHPDVIIVSEEQLKSKGWSRSSAIVFVSADMTLQKGQIVLKGTYLAKRPKYTPAGMGRVSFDGTIVLPTKTADTEAGH